MTMSGSWAALFVLGAVHGINPAMGWLFAVALGMQEERRSAVLRTLGPLAVGHALSIGAVLMVAATIGFVIPAGTLKWIVAAMLLLLGIVQLRRHYHPRAGMRIGARDLTIWSFLIATAHGAGLMAIPFVMMKGNVSSAHMHAHHNALVAGFAGDQGTALIATGIHTLGYLAVTALIALLAYDRLGLKMLRSAWININLLWAVALMITALLTPLI